MAIRRIRENDDDILRKKAKEVEEISEKIITILNDMADTMYENNGVGLAGPQVGILKRIAVIDIGDGLVELINPCIISEKGEQTEIEGCLSLPGLFGEVQRPKKVVVQGWNRKGEKIKIKGEDFMARAICHEVDHLDGVLFKDKVIKYVDCDTADNEGDNPK